MSSLRNLQHQFLEAILYPASSDLVFEFVEAHGLSPAVRVAIYRNNIQQALFNALTATYPVMARLVGDDYFRYLMREFVVLTPSVSGNLEDYGAGFAEFIDDHHVLQQVPYLGDVARLEWALQEVYQATAPEPFDAQSLTELSDAPPERVCMRLNAASRLLVSRYPLLKIWKANQDDATDTDVILDGRGARLVVLQRHGVVEILPICRDDFAFLECCARGSDLLVAYEAAAVIDPKFDLGVCLDKYIRLGALTGWSLRPSEPTKETCDECCH